MKITIISDTHGNVKNFSKAINWIIAQNIEMILHCGDIGSPESLAESLKGYNGKIYGVLGNMDNDFAIEISEYNKIPNTNIKAFSNSCELVNGKKVAITHKPEDAKKLAESKKYDIVFYGHTHKPWEEKITTVNNKICRLINPGELAGQIFKPSFAIYDTEKDFLQLKILETL